MKLVVDDRQLDLVRRFGLAIGGAILAGGVGTALSKITDYAVAMAIGAGILGFFAPRWPERKPPMP